MQQGYFAALKQSMYRQTRDERRVIALRLVPLFARRYFLVPDDARGPFERRVVQAHVAGLVAIAAGVQVIGDPDAMGFALFLALALLVLAPATQAWMTRGLATISLTEADLEPVTRSTASLRYARAAGARTLWGLLVASALMGTPQVYVMLADGVWWSWLGTVMFGAMVVYFGRMLVRLRDDTGDRRATHVPS